MTRFLLKPTKWDSFAYDFKNAKVELEKSAHNTFDRTISKYDVYVDDVIMGTVQSQREESSVQTGRGNRLRRVTGHPIRWRYTIDPRITRLSPEVVRHSYARESRYQAVKGLVQQAKGILSQATHADYERVEGEQQRIEAAKLERENLAWIRGYLDGHLLTNKYVQEEDRGHLVFQKDGATYDIELRFTRRKEADNG